MGRFHGELGGSHRVTNLVNWRFAHGGASPVRRNLSPLIAQLVPPRLYDLRPGPSSFAFPSSLLPSPVSLYIQTHTHTHTHTRTHTYIYNIYNTCGKKVVIDRLLSRVISTGDSVNFGPLFCLIVDESRNESLLTKNRLTFAISIECVFQFQQQFQIQLYDNSWDRSLKINGMHGAIHFEYNCAGANMTI